MLVNISPVFLANSSTAELRALAQSPDFIDACITDGVSPEDILGLETSRSARCLLPVVLDRINVDTGESSEVVLPCNSSNALKCPSCAELNQRLRQRQIMNGLEKSTVKVALFTNTAPSFGRVHRPSFSAKDAFKAEKMHPNKRQAFRLSTMKRKGKCPCGKYHDHRDDAIGTPLNPHTEPSRGSCRLFVGGVGDRAGL